MSFKSASKLSQAAARRPIPRRFGNFEGELLTDEEYLNLLKERLHKVELVLEDRSISKESRREYGLLKQTYIQERKFVKGQALIPAPSQAVTSVAGYFMRFAGETLEKDLFSLLLLRAQNAHEEAKRKCSAKA